MKFKDLRKLTQNFNYYRLRYFGAGDDRDGTLFNTKSDLLKAFDSCEVLKIEPSADICEELTIFIKHEQKEG